MSCLLALDEGTTSCRGMVFDPEGECLAVSQQEFTQFFPRPGWVEHDAADIASTQLKVAEQAVARSGLTAGDLAGIGITNQRETVVVWDRRTGEPVTRAIVWQDRRTAEILDRWRDADGLIRQRTGLLLEPSFCASKIAWILEHVDGARAAAEAGHLAFGTIDGWLLWTLTGGTVHATDETNASRTLLYDIHARQWDPDLLSLFDIPESMLPEVRPCSDEFGMAEALDLAVPIRGMIGDQQAALFGQACLEPGMVKSTYGTGCFLLLNTGETAVASQANLLTTVAWSTSSKSCTYALEGSVFMGGATIQWLRDGLEMITDADEINGLAASVEDSGGVVLVPAFAGLGAPDWDPWARGSILGMTRGTTRAHVARAALEGIASSVVDLLEAMKQDAELPLTQVRVDGGAAASDLLMQIQADLLDAEIHRPRLLETTAWGAAAMAGLQAGLFDSPAEMAGHWHLERTFRPGMSPDIRADAMARWRRGVDRARNWAREDGERES